MSDGKAVVVGQKNTPVSVPFVNWNNEEPTMSGDAVTGALIIVNCLDKFLRKPGEHDSAREKLIDGLASEVSLSYAEGWSNIYYCTFRGNSGFTLDDLPSEFTTSEDDGIFYFNQRKKIIEILEGLKPALKRVRIVGLLTESQLANLVAAISDIGVEIEADSPYLVTIDDA